MRKGLLVVQQKLLVVLFLLRFESKVSEQGLEGGEVPHEGGHADVGEEREEP